MSALYDSGLFDDDIEEAYSNGFNTAKLTLTIIVTTVCPVCSTPLVVTQHQLRSLPIVVHTGPRVCLKCETEVPPMIRITSD